MQLIEIGDEGNISSPLNLHNDLKTELIDYINYEANSFFIVTKKNNIFVYGDNCSGKLGNGTNTYLYTMEKLNYNFGKIKYIVCGTSFTIIVNKFNDFYYSGEINRLYSNYTFKKFNPIRNLLNFKFIRNYGNKVFIVTKENFIYCIGNNSSGALGLGSEFFNSDVLYFTKIKDISFLQGNNIKDLQCSSQHSVILDDNGNIYGCGNSDYFQTKSQRFESYLDSFTKINFNTKIKKISCQEYFTLLMDENFELFIVGVNKAGKFGLKSLDNPKNFTKIVINNKISNIYLNYNDKFILLKDYNNKFCFSGMKKFGIKKGVKLATIDNYSFFDQKIKCLDSFTKINALDCLKDKYIYPLLGYGNTYFVCCDYAIRYGLNDDEEFNDILGFKCLQKFLNNQLTDVTFHF